MERSNCELQIDQLGLRNNQFKFKILGKSPITLEESIKSTLN